MAFLFYLWAASLETYIEGLYGGLVWIEPIGRLGASGNQSSSNWVLRLGTVERPDGLTRNQQAARMEYCSG